MSLGIKFVSLVQTQSLLNQYHFFKTIFKFYLFTKQIIFKKYALILAAHTKTNQIHVIETIAPHEFLLKNIHPINSVKSSSKSEVILDDLYKL